MRKIFLLFAVMLAAVLWSCSEQASAPENEQQDAPMPAQVATMLSRFAVPVGIEVSDPEMQAHTGMQPDSPPYDNYDVYAITILWGSLLNTGTPGAAPVDWSGTLSVNGVVTFDLLHTISFENNQDHLIPTNNPAMVAWTSFTANDFDGLNCLVYVDKDIVYITAPELTFATTPFTISYNLEELANLSEFHIVGDQHGFAINARKIYSSSCPSGMIVGEWVRDDNAGASGTFNGQWLNPDGSVFGFLAGTFATSNTGARTFEGVVSPGALTVVWYYVYGTWMYDDPTMCPICGSGHGYFAGFYTDHNNSFKGTLKGEFGYAADAADNHLPLTGKWVEFCDNAAFAGLRWIK